MLRGPGPGFGIWAFYLAQRFPVSADDSVSLIAFAEMPEDVQLRKVVLLPGMDGTGELFAPFVEALPNGFEIIAARFPRDVCLSYSELAEIVQSLLPESHPFVIVAESFSTPLAIQCAALRPANLAGLVLCAGFAASPLRGSMRSLAPILSAFAFRVGLPTSLARRRLVGPEAPILLWLQVKQAIASVQPKVLSDRLQAVLRCDVRAELAKVNVPILYLQAAQDRLVPAWCAEEIREIRPDAKITRIDGPHLLLQRESERTADAVAGFVRGLQ